MEKQDKPQASIYLGLRRNALEIQLKNIDDDAIQLVMMDWNIANGTVTVLAAVDGTASIYFSGGGGYLGGGQGHPSIREAALNAVRIAEELRNRFHRTEETDIPAQQDIFFYIKTGTNLLRAIASEESLRDGSDPLATLGNAMQSIVTEYRLKYPNHEKSR